MACEHRLARPRRLQQRRRSDPDTNASRAVLAELHAFLTAEGVHPAIALGWFTQRGGGVS
jgi:hypothetical protein